MPAGALGACRGCRRGGGGGAALETVDALGQRGDVAVDLRPAEPHQRDLEGDSRVGLLGDVGERFADELQGPGEAGGAEAIGQIGSPLLVAFWQMIGHLRPS